MQRLEELDAEIESDTAELNSAAAKIQAGFRGYQVRKGLNNGMNKSMLANALQFLLIAFATFFAILSSSYKDSIKLQRI